MKKLYTFLATILITASTFAQLPQMGDFIEGGVVFWVDPADNTHAMICAIHDQSVDYGIQWNLYGDEPVTGAFGEAIGTGLTNTIAIIAVQGQPETEYAAGLAKAYAGSDEWYLPSKDELNQMWINKDVINSTAIANGGSAFVDTFPDYWSSTESATNVRDAWTQSFNYGDQRDDRKYTHQHVRAVKDYYFFVNSFPEAKADAVTVNEDSGANTLNVLANNGSGADSFGGDGPNTGAITLPVGSSANGATVTVNNGGTSNNPTDDTVVYTPTTDFTGTDTFDYTISDANGDTSTATVTINVIPVVEYQGPEKMSYQTIVRDSDDNLVSNLSVGMQLSILQTTATGTAVYVETQTPTANINGLVSLEIGTGSVVSGDFSTINWSDGTYFIKTETDPTGGTDYTITGTSQLLSVPYAFHAKTAVNAVNAVNAETANNVINDAVDDADSDPNNEIQTISKAGSTVTLSNGGGTFEDNAGVVYSAGSGIDIINNVVSSNLPYYTKAYLGNYLTPFNWQPHSGLTIRPPAGTYMVTFNCQVTDAVYVQLATSPTFGVSDIYGASAFGSNSQNNVLSFHTIVTANGSDSYYTLIQGDGSYVQYSRITFLRLN